MTKLLTKEEWLARFIGVYSTEGAIEVLRKEGLVAEEPVDPLRDALSWAIGQHFDLTDEQLDDIVCEARSRGMELAPRKELTREMVRGIVIDALGCACIVRNDFDNDACDYDRADAEGFVDRLHAAIQEALQ